MRTKLLPNRRRKLTTVIIAGLLATVTAATTVFAIGNIQNGDAMPGVSLEPTHARTGENVTATVSDIPDADDGYQVYLIPTEAIQDEADRSKGCVTHQHGDVIPFHLGTTEQKISGSETHHAATGQLPVGIASLPQGTYHPCVTWITDGQFGHWAAAATLTTVGAIDFQASTGLTVVATIEGGLPNSEFTLYKYDRSDDGETCSGGIVIARGTTQANGNASITINPLENGISIGQQICAGLSDGALMAYGTMEDLPGGVFLYLNPDLGPRGTSATITTRQTWPLQAHSATAYVESTPLPVEGQCKGTPPATSEPRHIGAAVIQDGGLAVIDFTLTSSAWQPGNNTVCIRWLTVADVPGAVAIMAPLIANFLLTGHTAANTADEPSPPGTPIQLTSTDLPPGVRLLNMQWGSKTYPVDTFSDPTGTTIVPPLPMHVQDTGHDEETLTRTVTLHWEAPDQSSHSSVATLHLTPVAIEVVGPNNGVENFTVTLTGIAPERPMAVNYCQQYGNQMPRRTIGTGTTASVVTTPPTDDTARLERGENILCIELTDWQDYGYDRHYLEGVHPAVDTFTYRVDASLTTPESATAGTIVDAKATNLPPGSTLREFIIDGISVQRGTAFQARRTDPSIDATAADAFGNATIRFIVPAKVGNQPVINRDVIVQAVYNSDDDPVTATGKITILPTTPEALGTLPPPGQLAGIPYLTFRPSSAIVDRELSVRTRNLVPRNSTLKALKLNGTLVSGEEDETSISTSDPDYVNTTVQETFGHQTVKFLVPSKIDEDVTANQITIELHWDPGEGNTDPYGNELIIVKRTIQLLTGDEFVAATDCSHLAQFQPGETKAGARLHRLRLQVATGQFDLPMQCPEPGTRPGNNTIPEGDVTIRLRGDFPTEQGDLFGPVQNATVTIRILDAEVHDPDHDPNHQHGSAAPVVRPTELLTVRPPEATSVTLIPGTLIRGNWSYQATKPEGLEGCNEVSGNAPTTIHGLSHGTEYELQVYDSPGCPENRLSGTVTFTTNSGSRSLTVRTDEGGLEAIRRGDALTIQIPGCQEWIQEGATEDSAYDGCHIRKPRYIEFLIQIPGLTMPYQATRDPDERVIFTLEWENHGLADHRNVHAYTQTGTFPTVVSNEPTDDRTPSLDSLRNQQTTFHRFGEEIRISAHGHVQYTDVEIHTAHDNGTVDDPLPGNGASSASGFRACADLLNSGVNIPDSTIFAGQTEAVATVNTTNGHYSRVGMYHACARGGGGIITSDEANGYYRARFVVAMSAEIDERDQTPNAGKVIRIQIHGSEAVMQPQGSPTEQAVVISDITIGGRRLAGPTDSQPKTWQNWKQENQFIYVMLPPEIQGNTSIRLWATSPEGSIDRTCADVAGRDKDLANIFDAACRHTFGFEVMPPQLTIINPGNELRINQEVLARVSGLPGSKICHATLGPLPVTLLSNDGNSTACVKLQPGASDSVFRLAMRVPSEAQQTRIVRYYILSAGDGQETFQQDGVKLSVVTDLNARASVEVTLVPPSVTLLNTGTIRRLDKLTLRGENFPRERSANFPIEITIGDCEEHCKNRRTQSVPRWEFDHILRRQPRPPGETFPMTVELADVAMPIEGEVETPTISMEIAPDRGQAEDHVTVFAQGLEPYRGGYAIHIMTDDGPGLPLQFDNPPQSDARGEFNMKGMIPWWEHNGGTAEYPVRFQLFDAEEMEVNDAQFMFHYRNRAAPATPRPTPPTTLQQPLAPVPATPRPVHPGLTPTDTPQPPTPTAALSLPAKTQPEPTATPVQEQPIRSLAELIQAKEPTTIPPSDLTSTPEPIRLIGQVTPEEPEEEKPSGISPWLYIAGGILLLLTTTAVGIAVMIWKRPPNTTVTPMGRMAGEHTPSQRPTIITGQGYLNREPPETSTEAGTQDPQDRQNPTE